MSKWSIVALLIFAYNTNPIHQNYTSLYKTSTCQIFTNATFPMKTVPCLVPSSSNTLPWETYDIGASFFIIQANIKLTIIFSLHFKQSEPSPLGILDIKQCACAPFIQRLQRSTYKSISAAIEYWSRNNAFNGWFQFQVSFQNHSYTMPNPKVVWSANLF